MQFYFHVDCTEGRRMDGHGLCLDTVAEAKACALDIVRELLADGAQVRQLSVCDASGALVYRTQTSRIANLGRASTEAAA